MCSAYDDRAGPPTPAYRFLEHASSARFAWLWPLRLPLGALTLLIGDPGLGKSLLTADLAARLSVPRPWPDHPASECPDSAHLPPLPPVLTDAAISRTLPPIRGFLATQLLPAGVVFAAPEDAVALPDRLLAAGADPARISILDGVRPPFTQDLLPLRLPGHADQLACAIRAHDHPRLVVLDPLQALLDDGVSSCPDLQSALFTRLAVIAREHAVALLAVGHFTKSPSRHVFHRIRGALSFVAAARSVLLLTPHPDCPDRRVLTQIKNAYGPLAPPLAFRIVPPARSCENPPSRSCENPPSPAVPRSCENPFSHAIPGNPFPLGHPAPLPDLPSVSNAAAPHLEWDDPAQPDWRLATGLLDLAPESFSALSEACAWLTDFLSAGPRPAREVLAAARAAGFPRATLLRAKRLLNIPSSRSGPSSPSGPTWLWLPA
jgi:hypothetical protein